MRVCGEVTTLEHARRCHVAKQPDLVVVDPEMEKEGGFGFIEELHHLAPEIRCVAVAGHLGRLRIERAFKAGAVAVISHFDSEHAILEALHAALHGTRHMTPIMLADFCSRMNEGMPATPNPFKILSPREKQIFRLIGKGLRIKEVAAQAGMSARTVESHEANIKKKLGLRDNGELRRLAILCVEREGATEKRAA